MRAFFLTIWILLLAMGATAQRARTVAPAKPQTAIFAVLDNGKFIEPIAKELPMEYAVELNRLIELQMEGSIG